MRVFIYKRPHTGDPDESGSFGINNCMGRCRSWEFDAVIGVGALGSQARRHRIDRKVNWIGIGPHRDTLAPDGWPVVTFDHFVLYNENGRKLEDLARGLARRMYENPGPRFLFSDNLGSREKEEISGLLKRAQNEPASRSLSHHRANVKHAHCQPRHRPPHARCFKS